MTETGRRGTLHNATPASFVEGTVAPHRQRLCVVLVQEAPNLWLARGLEHDIVAEGRTIGGALRAAIGFIAAHTAFDMRHDHLPLSAFRPAPQSCWNAHSTGTPVSLAQLGVAPPAGWDICAAVAHRRPER